MRDRDPVRRTLLVVSALLAGRTLSARDISALCESKTAAGRRQKIRRDLAGVELRRAPNGARAIRMKPAPKPVAELAAAFAAGTIAGEHLPMLGKITRALFAQPTDLRGSTIEPAPTDPNRPRAKR